MDSNERLAMWARAFDLDASEASLFDAMGSDEALREWSLEWAWKPVAIFGHGSNRHAMRKLWRFEHARQTWRDIRAEMDWSGLGDGERSSCELMLAQLALVGDPERAGALLSKALEQPCGMGPLAIFGCSPGWAALMGIEPLSRRWGSALKNLLLSCDWDAQSPDPLALSALSQIERDGLEQEPFVDSGQTGTKRL